MIQQELILLGLLKNSPKHGYEIKKDIEEILSLFAGIDLKSIYYPLRILEKKGYLSKRISKKGKRPQRLVYALTSKGQVLFNQLLAKSFLNFKRPQFSLDLSLYFLRYMQPAVVKRRLRARMLILNRLARSLENTIRKMKEKKDSCLTLILDHNLQMVKSESDFLARLLLTL